MTDSEQADQIIELIEALENRLAFIRQDVDNNYKYINLLPLYKTLFKIYKILHPWQFKNK
jgi:hypothetical protein